MLDFGIFVTALGGAIGYYIYGRRQKRREIRSRIDKFQEQIEQIEMLAHRYYLLRPADLGCGELEQSIRCLLKQAGMRASKINTDLPNSRASTLYIGFRQVVSGSTFESADRPALQKNDPIFDEISRKSRQLLTSIEHEFARHYSLPGE